MNRASALGVLVLCISLLTSPSESQEQLSGEMLFPGFRYLRENRDHPNPSYWPTTIIAQFHLVDNSNSQKALLTDILRYSDASLVDLDIVGFPNNIFEERNNFSPEVNFAVLGVDEATYFLLESGKLGYGPNPFSENQVLSEAIALGLVEQTKGCLVRVLADEENRILSFVAAYKSNLDMESKMICIKSVMPAAFGLFPLVNSLDVAMSLSEVAIADRAPRFTIESERIMALNTAAYCRQFLKRHDINCSYVLLKSVMGFHQKLAEKF